MSDWLPLSGWQTSPGVIDSYGIEMIHPIREGRSPRQYGRKGLSNRRWIVGGKLCLLLNKLGLVVAWDCDTANVSDTVFQPLIRRYEEEMIVCGDTGFHAKEGDPENFKPCPRGAWNGCWWIAGCFRVSRSGGSAIGSRRRST
ncbi:MAG: hypothetical protein QOH49_497 [Acidobacteriota bacterium]|nr:hypothetical protein [Acidobacteriota bacterium]